MDLPHGITKTLGVTGNDETVISVENCDEGVDLPERDTADGEEALLLADDVHHEVENGGGDGTAPGDAACDTASRLERKPVPAGSFTNQDTVVPKGFYQPPRLGSHSQSSRICRQRPLSIASYALHRSRTRTRNRP